MAVSATSSLSAPFLEQGPDAPKFPRYWRAGAAAVASWWRLTADAAFLRASTKRQNQVVVMLLLIAFAWLWCAAFVTQHYLKPGAIVFMLFMSVCSGFLGILIQKYGNSVLTDAMLGGAWALGLCVNTKHYKHMGCYELVDADVVYVFVIATMNLVGLHSSVIMGAALFGLVYPGIVLGNSPVRADIYSIVVFLVAGYVSNEYQLARGFRQQTEATEMAHQAQRAEAAVVHANAQMELAYAKALSQLKTPLLLAHSEMQHLTAAAKDPAHCSAALEAAGRRINQLWDVLVVCRPCPRMGPPNDSFPNVLGGPTRVQAPPRKHGLFVPKAKTSLPTVPEGVGLPGTGREGPASPGEQAPAPAVASACSEALTREGPSAAGAASDSRAQPATYAPAPSGPMCAVTAPVAAVMPASSETDSDASFGEDTSYLHGVCLRPVSAHLRELLRHFPLASTDCAVDVLREAVRQLLETYRWDPLAMSSTWQCNLCAAWNDDDEDFCFCCQCSGGMEQESQYYSE